MPILKVSDDCAPSAPERTLEEIPFLSLTLPTLPVDGAAGAGGADVVGSHLETIFRPRQMNLRIADVPKTLPVLRGLGSVSAPPSPDSTALMQMSGGVRQEGYIC